MSQLELWLRFFCMKKSYLKKYTKKINLKLKIPDCAATQNSVRNTRVQYNLLEADNCLSY